MLLLPKLRMSGVVLLFLLNTFMVYLGDKFNFVVVAVYRIPAVSVCFYIKCVFFLLQVSTGFRCLVKCCEEVSNAGVPNCGSTL